MKNILIFYEHIKREYEACYELKKILEKNNDFKVDLFSIQFEYFDALKKSKKYRLDMIIMPWVYTSKDYELVSPFLKDNPNLFIINIHHEQIAYKASEKILLPADDFAKNSVIHFCWGEYFKEKLIQSGVNEDYIYITGNIRTKNNKNGGYKRKEWAERYSLDSRKKWILFSENRGWILTNTSKKDDFLVYLGFDREEVEERKRITLYSIEKTIQELNELHNDFFELYELIYRPHPGTDAPKDINRRVKIINEHSIFDWLNVVDANVVWSSTAIFESDAMKIPSFVYEPIKNPEKFKTYGLENYQTIKEFSEINSKLIEEYIEHIAPINNYEKYIGKTDGTALKNTSDTILSIIETGVSNYQAQKLQYNTKKMIKKYIFEKITRIISKAGVLGVIKFPRTSYQLKADIPYINNNIERSNTSE